MMQMQCKYPVRFLYGGETGVFSKELFGNLYFFESKYATKSCITGETEIPDLLLDFNDGLRLQIPRGNWHAKISDYSSNFVFMDEDILEGATLISVEKYFVHWEITLALDGEICFYHRFDPTDQQVHFMFPNKAMGDNITLFPYMKAFKEYYNCRVSCTVPDYMQDIVKNYYPDITLSDDISEDNYATYYMVGQNFNEPITSTENIRFIPLKKFGHSIVGWHMNVNEKVIFHPTKERKIKEPYVCIAIQASGTPKAWLNYNGWNFVVKYLKELGYRVLCIDRESENANYGNVVKIPEGAEDYTGDVSLIERINLLAYSDFFIGLSSGLAWLAWSVDIPVIMISGITKPWYEFKTPYRIYNNLVCNGCFNDMRYTYKEIFDCPRYKDTEQIYECSKKISAQQVIDAINRLIADNKAD